MHKYTVVLIPQKNVILKFINWAREQFGEISSRYLLGDNSIPHITIAQFECEVSLVENLKKELNASTFKKTYTPEFSGFEYTQLDNYFEGYTAAELGVSKSTELLELHSHVLGVLEKYKLKPLNAHGESYRPHMTLAMLETNRTKPEISETEALLRSEKFELKLGASDENFQLAEIIE